MQPETASPMITAAATALIAIATITNVLNVFVFGLTHSVEREVLDELVVFCTSVVELIVLWTSGSE